MKLLVALAAAVLLACGPYTAPPPTPARSDVSKVEAQRTVTAWTVWTSREQVPEAYRHTVDWNGWTEPVLAVFSGDEVCTFLYNVSAPFAERGQQITCHWYSPRGVTFHSPAETHHILAFNAALLRQWSLLFDHFDVEFLQCVYAYAVPGEVDVSTGEFINDTIKVALAINANLPPSAAYRDSVTPPANWNEELCPASLGDAYTLFADVHNHLPRIVNGVRTTYCYPSEKDYQASFGRGVHIAFILCDKDRFASYTPSGVIANCTWDPEDSGHMPLVCKREEP